MAYPKCWAIISPICLSGQSAGAYWPATVIPVQYASAKTILERPAMGLRVTREAPLRRGPAGVVWELVLPSEPEVGIAGVRARVRGGWHAGDGSMTGHIQQDHRGHAV
jgi:hypothetical protein